MPCYSPVKIKYRKYRVLNNDNINKNYKSKLKPFDSVDSGYVLKNNYYSDYKTQIDSETKLASTLIEQYVECGKCYSCRSKKSNEWAMRVSQELFMSDSKGVFVTLTYSDKYLPKNNTVEKEEVQNFLKRLRYHIKELGFKDKIKYFACGEYGTIRHRAHYHLIITGYTFSQKKMSYLVEKAWSRKVVLSKGISSYELMGRVQVRSANAATVTYTTKYMMKDSDLNLNEEQYWKKYKKAPPFRLVSKGLGKTFCFKYLDSIVENGYIKHNGFKLAIPRTYLRWIRNYIGSEKFYELIQSRFLEYKKVHYTLLSLQYGIELNTTDYIFEEDIYNILNQSKLLPFYLNKLKEIQQQCTEKHNLYLEAKRNKSMTKLASLGNVA